MRDLLGGFAMLRKIVLFLLLAALAARLAYDAPVIQTRVVIEVKRDSAPVITQPFMYGGIRG
jgi:hypothetical protein